MIAAAHGTPDWQGFFLTENFSVLPAYGDASLYFAVPRVARLAEKSDRSPEFFLEFVSDRNGAGPGESLYATIDMGLTRDGDLTETYGLLAQRGPGVGLMPATFTTGTFWHLECVDLHETAPFAWEDAQRAVIHTRIGTKTAELLYGSLAGGALQIARAAVECEMAAFLPRIESTVTFHTASLLEALGTLSPGGRSVPFRQMVAYFDKPNPGLLRFDGDDTGATGRSLGLALAGRVRRSFGQAAPCPRIADGPHVTLKQPLGAAPELMSWDLRTPLMTGVPVFLDFDPFTPVVLGGARDRVTAFTRVPPLPEDLLTQTVSVACGLPPNIQAVDAVELTLLVAKEYSRSGLPTAQSVTLHPSDQRTTTVELNFGKSGAKPYSARVRVVSEDGITDMPWFDCSGDYLYIGAERLPGTCVTVRATPRLLGQAVISLAMAGRPAGTLTEREPAITFLESAANETARLTVTARDPAQADNPLTLDLPCLSLSLDLPSFHQYGPQSTAVTVQFHDGVQDAQFEFLPEGDEEGKIVLAFSASRTSGQFSYFSTRLFKNRYRFRRADENGGGETEWSVYQTPGRALTIPVHGAGH